MRKVFLLAGLLTMVFPCAAMADGVTAELNYAHLKSEGMSGYSYRKESLDGAEIGVGYDFIQSNFRVTPYVGAFASGTTKAYEKIEAAYRFSGQWDIGVGYRWGEGSKPYAVISNQYLKAFAGPDYAGIGLKYQF